MLYKEQLDDVARGGCQGAGCGHDHSGGLDLAQRCHVGTGSRIIQHSSGEVVIDCAHCSKLVAAVACVNPDPFGMSRILTSPCCPAPVVASYVGGSGKLKVACFKCRKVVEELEVREAHENAVH